MRNRAKCKLCNSVIESFHKGDYVNCKCGEISVFGGSDEMRCSANEWANFLRVDDKGNEIVVTVKGDDKPVEAISKPNRNDLLGMLDDMAKSIEGLPQQAMSMPVTNYDLLSLLLLLSALLRADDCRS